MIPPHDSAEDHSDDIDFRQQGSQGDDDAATRTYVGKEDQPTAGEVPIPLLEPGDPETIGKFRILQRLGKGGMGVVYKAYDEALQRYVAIKSVSRELASSDVARRRFIREARAVAAIRHTNVITIHAVESQSEIPYLVMELIDGCTLRAFRKREEQLTALRILSIAAQIASGLTAAHVRGVVHRDVKLTNIMIDASDRVVITDFGLARAVIDNANLTSGAMPLVTPAYMSPEQVRGESVDARSDLFSFGCVLYAMYTGYSPFQGLNPLEMARKVTEFKPPSLKDVNASVPGFFSDIVDRLLQKDPDKRYQSSLEVRDLLLRHLRELNQSSTDELDAILYDKRNKQPRPRWAWISSIAATLVLLIAIGGWASGWFTSEPTIAKQNSLLGKLPSSPADMLARQMEEASPGDTIELPAGTYRETITLENVQDVTLQPAASGEVVFEPSSPDQPIFRLIDSTDITLAGLVATMEDAPFVSLDGQCQNITLQGLTLSQAAKGEAVGMVQVEADAEIEGLTVSNCQFDIQGLGQAIWIEAGPVAKSIAIDNNDLQADYTHVGILRRVDGCEISHNHFSGGANAINLSLDTDVANQPIEDKLQITNNTMVNVRFWLGLHDTIPPKDDFAVVVNNLLIDCGRMQGGESGLRQAIKLWHWEANFWQPAFAYEEDDAQERITRIDTQVTTRIAPGKIDANLWKETPSRWQPEHRELVSAGAGGKYPTYVGAVNPDDD